MTISPPDIPRFNSACPNLPAALTPNALIVGLSFVVTFRSARSRVGFYPASHRGHNRSGYAASFDEARAGFETAWKNYLPQCTEADFHGHRRQRAWTAWKYSMYNAGLPLPTQSTSGQARCFCGAAIDIAVTDRHVHDAHMDSQHA
ncbi:hypothetical protein [Bradyrhizobium sp. JYMT SZCCT0428]|uniref:hypothetical protein n=1 Tax=Bradyrhizobium sp. JYMT SZCCT0428 TaxID=2807673 RepID=UPI001BA90B1A|nr:hypothetical protein [Bradyrhizobium sp. JYMT SZCCT0428]MBR1153698.1 hypothetical protein [Bradyrhizobium sp. JYMT SZCCT0428]